MTEIFYRDEKGKKIPIKCPFGIRDLKNDECYTGMGVNRCKYFVRYKHYFGGETLPNGKKVINSSSSIICKGKFEDRQLKLF